jgi:hypothetical protein
LKQFTFTAKKRLEAPAFQVLPKRFNQTQAKEAIPKKYGGGP